MLADGDLLTEANRRDEKDAGVGVSLLRLEASGLVLKPKQPSEAIVDLTDARVGAYDDSKESWPEVLRLRDSRTDSSTARGQGR